MAAVPSVSKLDLDKPRFDDATLMGRFRNMMRITSPSTLLCTRQDLSTAKTLLAAYRDGSIAPTVTEAQLWRAQQIRDSMEHPQTGQVIPAFARMSAFMPVNIILCYGLLLPQASVATTMFWQWLNQSYNLVVNHANRNATNAMSVSQMALAYGTAVTASCSIAVGLGQLVKRGVFPKSVASMVPYTAVASAGVANVFVMRWNEVSEGVVVKDKSGRELGVSQRAGLIGVSLSAVSRAVWSIPALVIPPVVMNTLKSRSPAFARTKVLHIPMELLSIAVSLTFGVPFAISLFQSNMEVSVDRLESKFQGLRYDNGEPIKTVFFNKGL
jgi:tricarboxylate carrier